MSTTLIDLNMCVGLSINVGNFGDRRDLLCKSGISIGEFHCDIRHSHIELQSMSLMGLFDPASNPIVYQKVRAFSQKSSVTHHSTVFDIQNP